MANITNYKCPACTGPLHFVGSSGMLECDYCGGKYNIDEMNKMYSDKVREEAEKNAEAAEAESQEGTGGAAGSEGESQTTVNADFASPEAHDWDSSIKILR